MRARVALAAPGFAALSFHSRRGVVFYALTDRAATKGGMEALIVTPEQLRALVGRDDEDNPREDLRIVSPTAQGFVHVARLQRAARASMRRGRGRPALTCASERRSRKAGRE